jgi:integrase
MASVRKRQWGEAKVAWVFDYTDNRGQRQRKHFATKKDADAFRVTVEGQLQAATYRPDAGKLTVKQVCDSFLAYCEGRSRRDERMTRKVFEVYRGHINKHILPSIGSRRLSQLTARAVGEFRDRIRTAGVTVPTTRKVLATLHGILQYAISQDWIATNAAHRVRVIGPRGEGSAKVTAPSKEDMRRLIAAADEGLRLMLIFAAATGARAGEQWAVRWDDVDLDSGELRISRRVDSYGEEGAPKSTAGVRMVPLSGQLASALKAWKLKSRFSKPEHLIFANRRGRYLKHNTVFKRRFLPLFAACGVTRFTWHGLRHFAVSTWIEAGLAPKTVQTFAGHASLQVTMDRYGHLFPSQDHRQAMDRIASGLFRNI